VVTAFTNVDVALMTVVLVVKAPSQLLFRGIFRLRHGVRTIKEKDNDLLEYFFPDVYGTVGAVGRLHPVHFARTDLPSLSFSAITEFDI
jgi:hypothetical protein